MPDKLEQRASLHIAARAMGRMERPDDTLVEVTLRFKSGDAITYHVPQRIILEMMPEMPPPSPDPVLPTTEEERHVYHAIDTAKRRLQQDELVDALHDVMAPYAVRALAASMTERGILHSSKKQDKFGRGYCLAWWLAKGIEWQPTQLDVSR